jgi:hypothetical protein
LIASLIAGKSLVPDEQVSKVIAAASIWVNAPRVADSSGCRGRSAAAQGSPAGMAPDLGLIAP